MLKLKMMLCVKARCCQSSSVAHQSSLSVRRAATTASGVDNAASPDWQTPLTGLFHPQRELTTMQKQLEGTQKYINEQCRQSVPVSTGNRAITSNYAEYASSDKCLRIKTEQTIYECLLGFVLTTFSAPPQTLAASTAFRPIPETKK